MRKKIYLKYRKQRAILSDVLPYEIPATFSNRHFYDFLLSHNIEHKRNKILWDKSDDSLDEIIKILFCIPQNSQIETKEILRYGKQVSINSCQLLSPSIPFCYKISHKQNEYRELAVPHPKNQVQLVEFYHNCKELILYYCSVSNFSIRRPHKIATYIYHKDKTHYDSLSDEAISIEEADKEYENLRSFFVYKEYSNIYKFYESYKYHRAEKKYNNLIKLDISKCFDSIYTHSLTWALLGKDSVKENIGLSKNTFAGHFDSLMMNINYLETNGIIIGPEFSRIFAELILQRIDKEAERSLLEEHKLRHKVHYEIFRYVDDYFIFFNDEHTKDTILSILQIILKEYKLYLNSQKAILYNKPIITEITRAKQRISALLDDRLVYKLEVTELEEGSELIKGHISVNSKALITEFKTIIKECEVEYKDMLNYSLAIVENQSEKIIKAYSKVQAESRNKKQLVKAILEILEFVFFIYSVSPRVNTTIKLCRILRIFTQPMNAKEFNKDYRHVVFKFIHDEICFVLKKNKNGEHTQVETLYLLIALSELGKDYWLPENTLADYFDINLSNKKSSALNYFSVTVLLFYMKNKNRYDTLRSYIENDIWNKFHNKKNILRKDTELTFLFLDSMSCPYLSDGLKRKILKLYGIDSPQVQSKIINRPNLKNKSIRQLWFTKWDHFDFGKELDAKYSQEVY